MSLETHLYDLPPTTAEPQEPHFIDPSRVTKNSPEPHVLTAAEPQAPYFIDPGPVTNISPEPDVYDLPPTAADQDAPAASAAEEKSQKNGNNMSVKGMLFGN